MHETTMKATTPQCPCPHRFQSKWGPAPDTAEFLIKPSSSSSGRGGVKEDEGALVTYRAVAGEGARRVAGCCEQTGRDL